MAALAYNVTIESCRQLMVGLLVWRLKISAMASKSVFVMAYLFAVLGAEVGRVAVTKPGITEQALFVTEHAVLVCEETASVGG
jgi:hypothetical protein